MQQLAGLYSRTKKPISLWIGTVPFVKTYPTLKGNKGRFDVAVIGGGITGISTAMKLKEAGKRTILLESDHVGSGVTGYSTAKATSIHRIVYNTIAEKHGKDGLKQYAAMNEEGVQLIAHYVNKFKIDCDFDWRKNFTYTTNEKNVDLIKKEVENANAAGLNAFFTTETELPFKVLGAIGLDRQVQFNPYKWTTAMAENFHDGKDFCIYEGTRVKSISSLSPYTISTPEGTVEAENVVMATHLPILDRTGHFASTKPTKSYVITYNMDKEKIPKHMYITAESDPSWSFRSCVNDTVFLIGGGNHSVGSPIDGNTENSFKMIEDYAKQNFPVQSEAFRWAAHDYQTTDNLPFIGYGLRLVKTLYVSCGYKKWGLAMGATSGRIITDLILGKDHPYPLMDGVRWDPLHSGKGIEFQFDVTKHFVGDRISQLLTFKTVDDLAVGEGSIVKHKGKAYGAYKDDQGTVHMVSPVCTHLGCRVTWNQAEKSWDCPCHGSRFDYTGEVLHGPAVDPLKSGPEAD